MGQADIISFLKNNPKKWFNAKEISTKLNVSVGSVLACLRRLRKAKLIDFKPKQTKVGTVFKNILIYKFKKRK